MESIEDLRSGFSVLETDFRYLSEVIESVTAKFQGRNQLPPILYLEHFSQKIEANLRNIRQNLNQIYRISGSASTVELLRRVHYVHHLMVELNSDMSFLESFVNQRISGTAVPLEFIHYAPSVPFEITTMQKILIAADCVCRSFFEDILGRSWLEKEKCVPSSYFGESYAISPVNCITQIPLSDRYRCRFWPIISHEVAHVKIVQLIRQKSRPFLEILFEISQALQEWPLEIRASFSTQQVIELMCDLIGTHICGPSFAIATAESLRPELPLREPSSPTDPFCLGGALDLIWAIRSKYKHPPNDVRISLVLKVIENAGIQDPWLYSIKDFVVNKYQELMQSVDLIKLNVFLDVYESVVSQRFDAILDFLDSEFPSSFREEQWKKTKEKWDDAKFCSYWADYPDDKKRKSISPTELLNLVWLDRKARYDNSAKHNLAKFSDEHRNGTTLFPYVVESLCSYYSKHYVDLRIS
jgi:hypothetical protein